MLRSKRLPVLLILGMVFALVLSACQAAPDTTQNEDDGTIATLQAQLDAANEGGANADTLATLQAELEAAQAAAEEAANATAEPTEDVAGDRRGGWYDTIIAVEEPNATAAIERILAGDLGAYLFATSEREVVNTIEENDDAVDWFPSYGLSFEMTFNTAGPEFNNGELNPFSVPAVREAMNWLVDRDYIVNEIMDGLAVPRYTAISTVDPDYVNFIDVISPLQSAYSYNPERAEELVKAEMEALGAELVDDVWMYDDAPVTIHLLIRTEDERRGIGDYFADQLETIGFTVDRQYKTRSDAGACWVQSDPAEGCFHVYTGGWSSQSITLDSGTNFGFWYTPLGGINVNSSIYDPTETFLEAATALWTNDYTTLDERRELFVTALEESMRDSARVWLVDQKTITPYSSDVIAAGDIAGGLSGSGLWAYTIRPRGAVGGSLNIAMPSILDEPWNAIQGSNSLYDFALQRAVSDNATVPDPFTGHPIPVRVERAEVTVQEGLPVHVTKDWVTLDTAEAIEVPGDAWADWDPVEQRFITVDEKFPEGVTSLSKSVVYYPEDMFDTVKWHDGSPLSVGDFVMLMITTLDIGNANSPFFDPTSAPTLEAYLSHFKGVRIVSTDPLVIETYDDQWFADAEVIPTTWWPYYAFGQTPWHTLALGLMAQEAGTSAFSADKALEQEVEQLSYLSGPTIEILAANLEQAAAETHIPYAAALGEFITDEEATARYTNLTEWFRRRGHFWIGTGPYFLQRAFPVEGTVILEHNPDYVDLSSRWSGFSEAPIPTAVLDGPSEVTIGDEASFTIGLSFNDAPYAAEDIARVLYLVYDSEGNLVRQGEADGGEDGTWTVSLDTSDLPEGSNRLQIVVISKRVGLPVFVEQQFVSIE